MPRVVNGFGFAKLRQRRKIDVFVYTVKRVSNGPLYFELNTLHVIHGQIHRHFITRCFVTRVRKCSIYCPILIDYLYRSVSSVCRFSTVAYETFISASTSLSLCLGPQESNDITLREEHTILTDAKIVL